MKGNEAVSDVMTLHQTAAYLHLHPVTLRNKARRGEIPAVKLGRQWRFIREELDAWLAEQRPAAPASPRAHLESYRQRIVQLAEQFGARNVRLFGSAARGDDDAESDVDLLVELQPDRSLMDLAGLKLALEELLGRPVDVVTEVGLRDRLRERVLREAVAL